MGMLVQLLNSKWISAGAHLTAVSSKILAVELGGNILNICAQSDIHKKITTLKYI